MPSHTKRKADASLNARSKRQRKTQETEEQDPSGSNYGYLPVVGPYNVLPPPTGSYVRLRFQMAKLKGVYRVVNVPLTFTFANLHK